MPSLCGASGAVIGSLDVVLWLKLQQLMQPRSNTSSDGGIGLVEADVQEVLVEADVQEVLVEADVQEVLVEAGVQEVLGRRQVVFLCFFVAFSWASFWGKIYPYSL